MWNDYHYGGTDCECSVFEDDYDWYSDESESDDSFSPRGMVYERKHCADCRPFEVPSLVDIASRFVALKFPFA